MEKKDVIKDERSGKIFFDSGIIRNFETVLDMDLTWEQAKERHPEIIKIQ